jgi:hypothetical protein
MTDGDTLENKSRLGAPVSGGLPLIFLLFLFGVHAARSESIHQGPFTKLMSERIGRPTRSLSFQDGRLMKTLFNQNPVPESFGFALQEGCREFVLTKKWNRSGSKNGVLCLLFPETHSLAPSKVVSIQRKKFLPPIIGNRVVREVLVFLVDRNLSPYGCGRVPAWALDESPLLRTTKFKTLTQSAQLEGEALFPFQGESALYFTQRNPADRTLWPAWYFANLSLLSAHTMGNLAAVFLGQDQSIQLIELGVGEKWNGGNFEHSAPLAREGLLRDVKIGQDRLKRIARNFDSQKTLTMECGVSEIHTN